MKYLVFLFLPLAACGQKVIERPEPIIVTKEVKIPVAGGCVPKEVNEPPEYVDTDDKLKSASDAAVRYQLLWAGRAQRNARLDVIEPIIAKCPRG